MTDTAIPTPTCELTGDEMFDSLTGFEEIAIAQAFRRTVGDLAQNDPLQLSRALVFAHMHRGRVGNDVELFKQVQNMGTKAVREYFAQAVDVDPAAPESESGKDDSPAQ